MATQVDYTVKLINVYTRLRIRNGPSLSNQIIGYFSPGSADLKVTQEENGWYYMNDYGGWSSAMYLEITGTGSVSTETVFPPADLPSEPEKGMDDYIAEFLGELELQQSTMISGKDLETTSMRGIWGAPYQFMDTVDIRLSGTKMGRTYADRIVQRMPLLLLAPGRVDFAGDYANKYGAAGMLMDLIESGAQEVKRTMEELVSSDATSVARYYTFDFDYDNYYKYVNPGMKSAAQYLNLEDVEIELNGVKGALGTFPWSEAGQKSFKGVFSTKEYVGFYVESPDSRSESLSNSTGESEMLSTIQGIGGVSRELQFLTGISTGKDLADLGLIDEDGKSKVFSTIDSIQEKYFKNNTVLHSIASNFTTLALGGQLIFPEIWQGFDFGNDFSCTLKLRSPEVDDLSWYLNIWAPLWHLVSMTAPKQSDNPNGYGSPFLVRGFMKGLFNTDMGIMSLNIKKGSSSGWTVSGLPTEIDVDIEIKDLYHILSLTDSSNPGNYVNNIGLMSYISNSCGVNFVENDIKRVVRQYLLLEKDKWKNLPHNIVDSFSKELSNYLESSGKFIRRLLPNI